VRRVTRAAEVIDQDRLNVVSFFRQLELTARAGCRAGDHKAFADERFYRKISGRRLGGAGLDHPQEVAFGSKRLAIGTLQRPPVEFRGGGLGVAREGDEAGEVGDARSTDLIGTRVEEDERGLCALILDASAAEVAQLSFTEAPDELVRLLAGEQPVSRNEVFDVTDPIDAIEAIRVAVDVGEERTITEDPIERIDGWLKRAQEHVVDQGIDRHQRRCGFRS